MPSDGPHPRAKGGLSPRLKGDNFERLVLKDQEARGRYCVRLRQGGGQVVDLLSLEPCGDAFCSLGRGAYHLYFIQVKARKVGKRAEPLNLMSPAERAALVAEAASWKALPVLAWSEGGIRYKEVE